MEKFFEGLVLTYLTAPRNRFVSPQFTLSYEAGVGGACPDFVVLDFGNKTVYVVELTTKAAAAGLLERVQQRDTRWITPLRTHLGQMSPQFNDWRYRVTLFVRPEICEDVQHATAQMDNVFVLSLANVVFPWRNYQGPVAVNPLE
jgi:Holliday junction resolvase-like predicted endonuclease